MKTIVTDTKCICEACGKEYEYSTEPSEVKQGGNHICPLCWWTEE